MRKIFLALALSYTVLTAAQSALSQTKFQEQAAGFWRIIETRRDATPKWLVMGVGDSTDTMTLRWPTGTGCNSGEGRINGNGITVLGSNFPAVIQITGPKTATLIMFGGQIIVHMKKTKESTNFLCE